MADKVSGRPCSFLLQEHMHSLSLVGMLRISCMCVAALHALATLSSFWDRPQNIISRSQHMWMNPFLRVRERLSKTLSNFKRTILLLNFDELLTVYKYAPDSSAV